ncbi:DUF4124 domain-containing protein [Marinobacter fuscus]|uniref:DUF4124 domain-containing protein n=1 Tax=Marinobacter fuscus TaxID=2109942 RepID=A0A2T1KVJ4_9GAMM|nr:DUF4124 domain-containing protein [Marinobacter fuscus]PSF14116.1 DUF4124 domain-containing protein [Marinobacter fuscus]
MPRKTLVALLFALVAFPATAEIYRWTDSNGATHFSDTPPVHRQHSRLELTEPVTVPMNENIRQADKVRQSRAAVGRLLTSGSKDRFAAGKQARREASQCEGYRKRLARIQGQLRAGYSNDRGNNLRQKRRELSQLYSQSCILN